MLHPPQAREGRCETGEGYGRLRVKRKEPDGWGPSGSSSTGRDTQDATELRTAIVLRFPSCSLHRHEVGSATDFPTHLNPLAPAAHPLVDDDLAILALTPALPSEHRPLPMGTFCNRCTVVPAPMGPSLPPLRNRPPIVAIRVTALRPMFAVAVVLTLKSFAAVVSDALKAQLGCLSNTAERQGGDRSKYNPLPTEAHKNLPHRAELGLSHPLPKRMH